MKLTSEWPLGPVYWRTFDLDDTAYIIGLRDGTIPIGGSINYDHPSGFFQLELTGKDLLGPTIVSPGRVWPNDVDLVLTAEGQLLQVEDTARVTIDPGSKFELAGGVTQFFSVGSADSTITTTSSISQVTSTGNQLARRIVQSSTDESGAMVGDEVTDDEIGGIKFGLKVNGPVSAKLTEKIESEIRRSVSVGVATAQTYTEDRQITLKADKLVAVTLWWTRRYLIGVVSVGGQNPAFDATLDYVVSPEIQEYDSPWALPPELLAAYRQQNPHFNPGCIFNPVFNPAIDLADGRLVREVTDPKCYVICGGAKFHIPDPDTFLRLYGDWSAVKVVPDGALVNLPAVPRTNTVLKEEDDNMVWLIDGTQKRHITTLEVLMRYGGWGAVRVLWNGALNPFPDGAPVT